MGRVLEFLPDVGIGESADHVLTIEQSAKDLSFIARQRIEGFCGPLWSDLFACGDAVQSTDRVGWIFNLGRWRWSSMNRRDLLCANKSSAKLKSLTISPSK